MNVSFPSRAQDRYLFLGAAIGIALLVFAGFARTFYLKAWFGTPALPLLVHVHGVVMSSWIVLFLVQTFLIEKGRVDLHRRLGMLGAVLAVVIVVLGMFVVTHAAAREVHAHSPGMHDMLLLFAIESYALLAFAAGVAAALSVRHWRGDVHKRLMLLATLAASTAAMARLPFDFKIVFAACLFAPVAIDTVRHRRLHPVFGWGAPLLYLSMLLVIQQASTPVWQHFAERLVS